jgi:hypothetical protein
MEYLVIFVSSFIGLFISSYFLQKKLSQFFLAITHSQKITIQWLSFIFLPGVVLHELAHWFVASMLFVRTGDIEFMPQLQGNTVKLGSVAVAKTDPLRRFLIGVAPVLIGFLALLGLFYFLSPYIIAFNWQTFLLVYASFEIGNTMFSSKKDMEGALGLVIALLFIFVVLYILGIRVEISNLSVLFTPQLIDFLRKASMVVLIPLGINVLTYIILRVFVRRN